MTFTIRLCKYTTQWVHSSHPELYPFSANHISHSSSSFCSLSSFELYLATAIEDWLLRDGNPFTGRRCSAKIYISWHYTPGHLPCYTLPPPTITEKKLLFGSASQCLPYNYTFTLSAVPLPALPAPFGDPAALFHPAMSRRLFMWKTLSAFWERLILVERRSEWPSLEAIPKWQFWYLLCSSS